MKRHKDLVALLRSNGMRITVGRRLLLQFLLDHSARRVRLSEIHAHMDGQRVRVDRTSIYRNLEIFKKLEIIQELRLPRVGKCFQYVLDRKVHHFYICKVCGKAKPGDRKLFERIEVALQDIHGFAKANLSVVFYGTCAHCAVTSRRGPLGRAGRGVPVANGSA
jgi:Fur family ferric uptake transcriptional regulator